MKLIEFLKNYREDSIDVKVDKDRSIFPFLSNSGYKWIGSDGKFDSVLNVPSGKRFILEGIWAYTSNSGPVRLFDGQSGSQGLVTYPAFWVSASANILLSGLKLPFESGVFMSTGAGSVEVRVWGYLINSGVR